MTGIFSNTFRSELENKYINKIVTNSSLNRQIISYQDNKKLPIFDWFPFKEGFSYKLVSYLINDFGIEKIQNILDPFAGSGTTLFVAKELGINSVGIELLPIGEFIFRTRKILESFSNIDELANTIIAIKEIDYNRLTQNSTLNYRHLKITEKAFPKETEKKLNLFLNYLENSNFIPSIKHIVEFACFSILEKISFTRKDGQCLRWDQRAKKGKSTFDKGHLPMFEVAIVDKLRKITLDIESYKNNLYQTKSNLANMKLIGGSIFNELPNLDTGIFDLIITSPPYLNRYDYTRIYALELAFLGVNEQLIRELRQELLSSTVESKGKKTFLKDFYSNRYGEKIYRKLDNLGNNNESLNEILGILEKLKKEKRLNNNGIVNMVRNYFYEHSFLIYEMFRVLRKGGVVYYVNDNVRYAGEVIPVDLILSEIAEAIGFEIESINILENGKGNSSQQMGKHGRIALRKCVYKWRKNE